MPEEPVSKKSVRALPDPGDSGPSKPDENPTHKASCGLVMPISSIDGCSAEHWSEVKEIIIDAVYSIPDPAFEVKLVSESDDVGVIQKRIVQNIYSSDLVICDVSGKNPNVMFELGLRLAFDKPTIIIKDNSTDYSFDTSVIEHLQYPRDLRFSSILAFKEKLREKVIGTYKAAKSDPDHSTFLGHFGHFNVAKLSEKEGTPEQLMLESIGLLQVEVSRLRLELKRASNPDALSSVRMATRKQGYEAVRGAVSEFLKGNPDVTPESLFGDFDFYKKIDGQIRASRYFDSYSDFKRTVDSVLLEV